MASVQDRLRQSRTPLDKWSTREQLCLASAVSCSGDQNWMSVSRTMKLVCGTGVNSIPRPADWYSQKSCAVQYGHLLENVETPKRKKRTSESLGNETLPAETPTDIVLRKLTEERMQELKDEIRRNQEEYVKIYKEVKELQTGNCSEERLLAIWQEIEQEEETKRAANLKLETEMQEREQSKQEAQRNWRTVTTTPLTANIIKAEKSSTEETLGTTEKSKPPSLLIQSDLAQQQSQISPLLSSLLKSPTTVAPNNNNATAPNTVRAAAPTITTLLTGGSIPVKQPVVILKNTEAAQLLARPASGPPKETVSMVQNLLSPSQSAPTLSMLLEKNKGNSVQNVNTNTITDINAVKIKQEQIDEGIKDKPIAMETDNNEGTIEMEEVLPDNVQESNNMEVDETDPNEEQQLLEVFKNIGNIELEIDTAFLTAMVEEPPTDNADITETEYETRLETVDKDISNKVDVVKQEKLEDVKVEDKPVAEENNFLDLKEKQTEVLEKVETKSAKKEEKNVLIKLETNSSDDSSDNVPLATVATSLESKEETEELNLKEENEQNEDIKKMEVDKMEKCENFDTVQEIDVESTEKSETESVKTVIEKEETKEQIEIVTVSIEDTRDAKEIKTEEEFEETIEMETIEKEKEEIKAETPANKNEIIEVAAEETEETNTHTLVIPVTDTDTDSSCTPEVEKSYNLCKTTQPNENTKIERRVSESSDSTNQTVPPSVPLTVTPARPPALRKLRERDRSESPMIGEDEMEHGSQTTIRLRRRACSTPLMDSVPNSPVSVSDREERELRTASKKSLMSIVNIMQQKHGKHIILLEKSFSNNSDNAAAKHEEVCLRPMDFQVIQQNIENGTIRSTLELQRDILLMCQNVIMLYAPDTVQHRAAMQIKQDCRNLNDLCQFDKVGCEKETKDRELRLSTSSTTSSNTTATAMNTSGVKSRSGFRKSQRIT